MNVLAWILAIALAGTYLGAGLVKLLQPRQKLMQRSNFGWAEDFSDRNVKGIGTAEVLGAIGVILPWLLNILRFLTPIAAVGLVALQVGAMLTHIRRKETKVLPGNVVLLLMAAVLAGIRFAQL